MKGVGVREREREEGRRWTVFCCIRSGSLEMSESECDRGKRLYGDIITWLVKYLRVCEKNGKSEFGDFSSPGLSLSPESLPVSLRPSRPVNHVISLTFTPTLSNKLPSFSFGPSTIATPYLYLMFFFPRSRRRNRWWKEVEKEFYCYCRSCR